MTSRISQIAERMKNITKGPWRINRHSSTTVETDRRSIAACGGYGDNFSDPEELSREANANSQFIANAPSDIQYLLEEREKMVALLEEARACCCGSVSDFKCSICKKVDALLNLKRNTEEA